MRTLDGTLGGPAASCAMAGMLLAALLACKETGECAADIHCGAGRICVDRVCRPAAVKSGAQPAVPKAPSPGETATATPRPTHVAPPSPAAPSILQRRKVASYVARLSKRDHESSSGTRLTEPAWVLQQDRANYHKYKKRDPDDTTDGLFADKGERSRIPEYLGQLTPSVRRSITKRTPRVRVEVFAEGGHHSMTVTVLDRGAALPAP